MKIDKRLNLVLTVERENQSPLYVHAMPLSEAAFDNNWLVISKTFAEMLAQGGAWMMNQGPKNAARMLRSVATSMGPDVLAEVEKGLLPEITRMATVLMPNGSGYEHVGLDEAAAKGILDKVDVKEVQNAITFFMLCCSCEKPQKVNQFMAEIFGMSNEQLTSSSLTELTASLQTSKPDGNTGEKVTPSSMPR